MVHNKYGLVVAVIIGFSPMTAWSKDAGKLAGSWIDFYGEPVVFTPTEIQTAAGGIQIVDDYKIDGNIITVYYTKSGSKIGIAYTLKEDNRACTADQLLSCLVRPDRAGKLAGEWQNESVHVGFTPTAFISPMGMFPVESYKIDGDQVTVVFRADRQDNNGGSFPKEMTQIVIPDGPDRIRLINSDGGKGGTSFTRSK